MVILALETATRSGSVALWDHGVSSAREGDGSRTHAERLPRELIGWAASGGRGLADVDLLAVVCGPGSFTGLRIGIAAVQGLALAGHRRVVAVPTLDALASAVMTTVASPALVVACLDGQRGDVFFAAFVAAPGLSIFDATRASAPAVAAPDEAAATIATLAGDRSIVLVGDGAHRYADVFTRRLPRARVVDALLPMAEAAATIAALRPDLAVPPHALRPLYVRRPDVELARERAGTSAPALALERFTVRPAEGTADLAAVDALQRETFTNAWGADAIRWELENTDVARLYLMHTPDGLLVAYCACWMVFDELHLNSLAVDPAWRRKGIAGHFLRHILAVAAGAGARSATLEVRGSNQAARALYEGLGFHVEGVRRDYYQEPREDALILWKRGL